MHGRANVRWATDHRATAPPSYCPIGSLSCWILSVGLLFLGLMSSQAIVLSGFCLSGLCPWGSVHCASIQLGYCWGTALTCVRAIDNLWNISRPVSSVGGTFKSIKNHFTTLIKSIYAFKNNSFFFFKYFGFVFFLNSTISIDKSPWSLSV